MQQQTAFCRSSERAIHSTRAALWPSESTAAGTATAAAATGATGSATAPKAQAAAKNSQPVERAASVSSALSPPTQQSSPAASSLLSAAAASDVWSSLYLAVKPPSSALSPALPVQPVKPATPSSIASLPPSHSRQSAAALPPAASYGSRPLPRLPLVLLLLLSVPGLLLARDDWRAQLIASYPALPWPHWMRVEATRLDRLSLEERRRRAESGWGPDRGGSAEQGRSDGSGSDGRSADTRALEADSDQQRLEATLHNLRAMQQATEQWLRERETGQQRAERETRDAQKRSLLSSIAAMDSAVREEVARQQDEVSRQVRGMESRTRTEFVGRLHSQAADITRSLAHRLTEQRQAIASEEQQKLRTTQALATQRAREEEVGRGVQRITEQLQQQEEQAEAFVQHSMDEQHSRLLAHYQSEADTKEAALQWAGREEQRLVKELEDVKQLQYVSANLHRLRLLASSVDELLHRSSSSSPELWIGVWGVLRRVGADDPVIAAAAASISDATLQAGVQPFDELQAAFEHIERPLRAATLQPLAAEPAAAVAATSTPPSLPGHLLSSLLSLLLLPQHSLVAGVDDSARLSRGCFYLYRSAERDIARCVKELAAMRGAEARETVSGWLQRAADRAAVAQAASIISTRLSTLELALIDRRHGPNGRASKHDDSDAAHTHSGSRDSGALQPSD